jgi:CRP-like cAMP-binding protein
MPNAFIRKLRRLADLTSSEVSALLDLTSNPQARRRGEELVREGDRPDTIQLMLSGWGCRYKLLDDGSRQILAFLLPGDLCDLHVSLLDHMDHSVALLSNAEVASVPAGEIHGVMERFRKIERALWCSTLVDEAILRQWLIGIGRRSAIERASHRLCELRCRLELVGLVERNGEFDLPLSQEDLADSLGLTSVHVNRTLAKLKGQGLIEVAQRRAKVSQPERLAEIGGFDAAYLRPCAPASKDAARPPLHG